MVGVDDLLGVMHDDRLEGRVGERAEALLALAQGRLAPLQLGDVDPQRRHPAVAQPIAAGRDPAIARQPLLEQSAIGRGMALEQAAQRGFLVVDVTEGAALERRAQQRLVKRARRDRSLLAAQIAVSPVAHVKPAVGIEDGEAMVERLERGGQQLMLLGRRHRTWTRRQRARPNDRAGDLIRCLDLGRGLDLARHRQVGPGRAPGARLRRLLGSRPCLPEVCGRLPDRAQDREPASHRTVAVDQRLPAHVDVTACAGLGDLEPQPQARGSALERRRERPATGGLGQPRHFAHQRVSDQALGREAGQAGRDRVPDRDPAGPIDRHHAVAAEVDERRGELDHGGLALLHRHGGSLSIRDHRRRMSGRRPKIRLMSLSVFEHD